MEQKELENIRKLYPKETLIKLIEMNDVQAPPTGTIGRVEFVDDVGNIHMNWDNGSSLALIVWEDEFEVLKEKDKYIPSSIEAEYDNYLSGEEEVDEEEKQEPIF